MRHKENLCKQQGQRVIDGNQGGDFLSLIQMSQMEEQIAKEANVAGNSGVPQGIANKQLRLDSAVPSKSSLQPNGEMIEQLVGLVEDDELDELVAIVQPLQEIHHLASEADVRCYVSEDVESFITPDKEQYATTAICRPKVGRKRISRSTMPQLR